MADRDTSEVRDQIRTRVREVGERLGLRTSSDRKAVSKLLDDPFYESPVCLFNCLLIKQNNPDWQQSD